MRSVIVHVCFVVVRVFLRRFFLRKCRKLYTAAVSWKHQRFSVLPSIMGSIQGGFRQQIVQLLLARQRTAASADQGRAVQGEVWSPLGSGFGPSTARLSWTARTISTSWRPITTRAMQGTLWNDTVRWSSPPTTATTTCSRPRIAPLIEVVDSGGGNAVPPTSPLLKMASKTSAGKSCPTTNSCRQAAVGSCVHDVNFAVISWFDFIL